MSLRKFAILCTLRFAVGVRPVAEVNDIANEGRLPWACDDDKMPDKYAAGFCEGLKSKGGCLANGCRQFDILTPTGSMVCKAKCKTVRSYDPATSSVPQEMGDAVQAARPATSSVPQAVWDAVQAARALVQSKTVAAAAKTQQAMQAEQDAKTTMAATQKAEEVAAGNLRQAEALETEARATKDKMEAAIAKHKRADSDLTAQSSAYEAALAVKEEKQTVMMQKLESKREQEARWKLEDKGLADTMIEINNALSAKEKRLIELEAQLKSLSSEVANLKARRSELEKSRTANKRTRKTEGRAITDDYVASVDAYTKDRDTANALAAAEHNAKIGSEQADVSARAAVKEYWEKVAAVSQASDKKIKAQKEAGIANSASLQAQFDLAESAEAMAQAVKERGDYEALRIKVEGVHEFAEIFYKKLHEVVTPDSKAIEDSIKNVMKLALDPAMEPCLSSYNAVITAGNDLAQVDETEILSKLKAGLTKIDTDRYEHFKQWCGNEDFPRWIWGGNRLTKVELAID